MKLAFMRKDTGLGVIHYEEQGVKGQGLNISASASGISFSGTSQFISKQEDMEVLAKTVSDAFKDHMKAKMQRERDGYVD